MWVIIGLVAVFLVGCILGVIESAKDGEREGVFSYSFFSFVCVALIITLLGINAKGNRELVTYTFSSKDYTFKREIVVSTIFKEVGDSLVAQEERDTLYILSGIETCVPELNSDAAEKRVSSEILDLRNKEK